MSSHWSEDEAVGGVEFTLSTNFVATAKIALLLLPATSCFVIVIVIITITILKVSSY